MATEIDESADIAKITGLEDIADQDASAPISDDSITDAQDAEAASKEQADTDRIFWVGIGASAGGLEALREFVGELTEKSPTPTTYIVAQHLSPTHRSMLVQLLGRETNLPVRDVVDQMRPEPDVIYITPPNSDVFVNNGTLYLRRPQSEYSPKPSVDYFLATLAQDQGDHAIAVILSGTGTDGSHGIRAIRASGGITIAQDLATAKYDGMPSSAIDTDCVDVVLEPGRMGKTIANVIASPRNLKELQKEHHRTDIQQLLFLVQQRSGVDFKDYKTGTLYRRINRRMAACGVTDLTQYLEIIQETPSELDSLYDDILISVSRFFRDTDAFEHLNKEIKALVA